MAEKENLPPLYGSVKHLQELFGIDADTAIGRVQAQYSDFKNRNQKQVESQDNQQNSAQIQLISHFALLATLTLTVVGFLLSQNVQALTHNQQIGVLTILICEVFSLFAGACDYIQTIKFHHRWAHIYQAVGKEADDKFESGELQFINELVEIDAKHLKNAPEITKMWVTYTMIAFCLLGLLVLLSLFYGFFFDIPGMK